MTANLARFCQPLPNVKSLNFLWYMAFHRRGEDLAKYLQRFQLQGFEKCTGKVIMLSLDQIKITHRDEQVLKLLVQGCSNKEIASELAISPRTVKQHLRTLFLRAGIKAGRKRVILATAMFEKEQMDHVTTRTA
ncbi:MAG TPA: helix-turn-helix transcriptional regulator [Terriglobales bacterium]|nr:helix-turn-helix transcriptional regulator [Terriglobales bacterium]